MMTAMIKADKEVLGGFIALSAVISVKEFVFSPWFYNQTERLSL
jgi:hypothetical protein